MKAQTDEEIDRAINILLTPDGKGLRKKASVLRELCTTCNANVVREKLTDKLDDKNFK